MQLLDTIFVYPIINLLVVLYHGLIFLHAPFALGFAIILLTIVIRFLLYPFTAAQLRLSKGMADLAPQLAKIKEKHKGDMRKQQEATMALYKEKGINPMAGCLPGLFQIVILVFGLYPALNHVLSKAPNKLLEYVNHIVYLPGLRLDHVWDTGFLGFDLAKKPAELLAVMGPIVVLVPVLTALFQFVQSKMMIPVTAKKSVQQLKAKGPQVDDFATTFQKQSVYLLPLMIGFFSWQFSVGLSLYWNTYTIFGIIQQYKMQGLGSLVELKDLVKRFRGK